MAPWVSLVEAIRRKWPEQVNLIFASDEKKIPSSVFKMQAEEKKAVIQWEGYSNVKRLMKTVSHVQRFFYQAPTGNTCSQR